MNTTQEQKRIKPAERNTRLQRAVVYSKGHLSTSLFDGEGVYFADIHELVCEDSSVAWAKAERIVACVNTCSKMADPAKEIAAMRRRSGRRMRAIKASPYPDQQALAKLQPFLKA